MMKRRGEARGVLAVVLWALCVALLPGVAAADGGVLLTVVQDDHRSPAMDIGSVALKRAPFDLVFTLEPYEYGVTPPAQVVASRDKALFSDVSFGKKLEDIEFLSPGTGMATEGPYMTLSLDTGGHHYVVYSSDAKGLRRVSRVLATRGSQLDVAWHIPTIDGAPLKVAPERIYLAFVKDIDLDGVIDPGELVRVELQLR